jgi:hypothetical protein
MNSVQNPIASLCFVGEAVISENRAPMVTGFSLWGLNPGVLELLRPNVVVPKQHILAAWLRSYKMDLGISMSCPHIADVGVS